MNLGSWNIGPVLVEWIRNNIQGVILELGSGKGSEVLSDYYTVYSVEHSEEWIGKYHTNYIYAPIKTGWYDLLKEQLPNEYHLLLVDGPPGNIGRSGILSHLHLFDLSVPIIVDDTHRKTEFYIANKIAGNTGRKPVFLDDHHDKQFAVI